MSVWRVCPSDQRSRRHTHLHHRPGQGQGQGGHFLPEVRQPEEHQQVHSEYMEWWREESNHTFFLHLAFMLLHADVFRFCFETITALTSTGTIKLLWGEFLHFDKKEDACEFILLHNDIFSDSAAFFDLLLPVQLMKADTVVRFHHLGETTDIFLSSQWQRSSSACSPSSPHHASKFPPLCDVFWMRLRRLVLWCQCFFLICSRWLCREAQQAGWWGEPQQQEAVHQQIAQLAQR